MEPGTSSPNRSPELPSVSPLGNGEVPLVPNPEIQAGSLAERREQRSGSVAERAPSPPPVSLPTPIIAVPTPTSDDSDDSSSLASDSPDIASDDELIEKEWVNKAKKVIAETKDDPYRREQEVSRLQSDYLLKRYGRELGSSQR